MGSHSVYNRDVCITHMAAMRPKPVATNFQCTGTYSCVFYYCCVWCEIYTLGSFSVDVFV